MTSDEHIERMVGAFCQRTEVLAGEHAILLAQQRQQAEAQHQALHAVHANAQQTVSQLAERQTAREVEIEQALIATRNQLLQEIEALSNSHDQRDNQLKFVIDLQLRKVLSDAQSGAQEMVNQQAKETLHVEQRMMAAIEAAHADLCSKIGHQTKLSTGQTAAAVEKRLDSRWSDMEDAMTERMSSMVDVAVHKSVQHVQRRPSSAEIAKIVHETADEMEARIELQMRSALQHSQRDLEMTLEKNAATREAVLRHDVGELVRCTAADTEHRVEEKMRAALANAQTEIYCKFQNQVETTEKLTQQFENHETKVAKCLDSLTSRIDAI